MQSSARAGKLDCVQMLHAEGVSLDWAPHFAATKGHIQILEYVLQNSRVLNDFSSAQETACYALEMGKNPEAALWLFEQERTSATFTMQAAIRSGSVDVIEGVYRHFYQRQEDRDLDLDHILSESFPFVWIHAIANPKGMCQVVEYLVSLSSQELEKQWRDDLFKRQRKRMRLASCIGRMKDMYDVQAAFDRGVQRKRTLEMWSGLTADGKQDFVERLMEGETNGNLSYFTSLVGSYLVVRKPPRNTEKQDTSDDSELRCQVTVLCG